MLEDLVGPVTHTADVNTEVVWVLGCRADGEGVPLVDRYGQVGKKLMFDRHSIVNFRFES